MLVLLFTGSIVPGSNKSYEEVIITATRDYVLGNQLAFADLSKRRKWTDIVKLIRVSLPV